MKFREEFDWTPFGEVPNNNCSGRYSDLMIGTRPNHNSDIKN
jgi:hypothetical protein